MSRPKKQEYQDYHAEPVKVRVTTDQYLDNRIAALEAEMRQLQTTYTMREAALAELRKMREAVVE